MKPVRAEEWVMVFVDPGLQAGLQADKDHRLLLLENVCQINITECRYVLLTLIELWKQVVKGWQPAAPEPHVALSFVCCGCCG